MSEYSSLKATINANVKTNNNQEITGSIMNSVLNAIVDSLGAGYQFIGVATPTNPGTAQTPDYKCFYLATTPGTYTNLGGLVVADGEVALLKYDTSWTKEVAGIATAAQLNQLGQEVIYDVTKNNPTAGPNNDGKFESLSALLSDENLSTLIPVAVRCGGMSIRFVQSSDNKYVQYRCTANEFTTDVAKWQGVDEKPLANSKNLVESGGVYNEITPKHSDSDFSIADDEGNNIVDFNRGHIKTKEFDSSQDATTSNRGLMTAADKAKLDSVEEGAQPNNISTVFGSADLAFSDEEGNNIVEFKHGHVKTKNFDSKNPIIKEANSHNDLSFVDENNNSVVEFNKGHVKTKYFDSANPPAKDEFTSSDFAVSDKYGNNVLEIKGGIPKTLKFDGDYFKFDKCITIKAIADAGVSQLFGEGEYGFNSATMDLFTKVRGVLTNVSELLNRNNVFKLPAYEDTLYTWNGYNFTSIGRNYLRAIPKIPYMVFNIDTNLRDISDMYKNINYGSVYTMLEQVYALFDELVAQHSDYITKVDAAEEVGLTYPTYCNLNGQASGDYLATPTYRTYIYKLCDNDVHLGNTSAWNHKRKIFITGGLHGNEYISPFNIYMLAKSLCDDFLESESFFKLRGTFDFYFIPCLNGYGQYHNTRANANKVNINRNFPTPDWAIAGEDTKDSDQGNNFTGYTAGSEFETQIVIKQLERIKPDIYIDHHNYGGESHYNYCTILTNKLYPLAGMSEVYAAYTLKKAYPQWFGNNFKGLLYGPAASPRVYYYTGKTLTASNYAGWKYQDMMAFTIETAPHIKVVNGEWTGEPQVPDYSKEVLTMDEYLLRMQIEVCANAYLFLNS